MKQTTKLQIYPGREKYFQRTKDRISQSSISQDNKRIIARYETYLASKGTTCELTRSDRNQKLKSICEWLARLAQEKPVESDLAKLDKQGAENLIAHINTLKTLSNDTKATYRKRLKQFYVWYEEEDPRLDNPDLKQETVKFYKYLKKVSANCKIVQADPKTIISDEDIQAVIKKGARMTKERAFLSLLHESGCRASEFLNLRIEDVILKDSYIELHVPDGKTGKRVIYASKSIPYLLAYLENHPLKDDKQSFLWICEDSKHKNQPLVHIGGQKLINRCFDRAGLGDIFDPTSKKKKYNPQFKQHNWHWFRHSRATILAPKMTEVMLCQYMGWHGNQQIKRYVHLCKQQLESVFLEINGIKKAEDTSDKPIKCICGTLNNPHERYCYRCYKPLSVETAIQDNSQLIKEMRLLTDEAMKTMQFFMEMAKNPELMKQFEEFKRTR